MWRLLGIKSISDVCESNAHARTCKLRGPIEWLTNRACGGGRWLGATTVVMVGASIDADLRTRHKST